MILHLCWGLYITKGGGIDKDEEVAFHHFMLAADEGDAYAQFNVGIHYYNGYGVKKDLEKAFEYFHLAAQQGIDNVASVLPFPW